jgi:hypothetical protein
VLWWRLVLLIVTVDVSTTTFVDVVRNKRVLVVVSRIMFVDVNVSVTLDVTVAVTASTRLVTLVLVTTTVDVTGTTRVTSFVAPGVNPGGSLVSVAASQTVEVTDSVTDSVTVRVTFVTGVGHTANEGASSSSPHAPNAARQPLPQYSLLLPQYPCSEQQTPQPEPRQVTPLPQVPSLLTLYFDSGAPDTSCGRASVALAKSASVALANTALIPVPAIVLKDTASAEPKSPRHPSIEFASRRDKCEKRRTGNKICPLKLMNTAEDVQPGP